MKLWKCGIIAVFTVLITVLSSCRVLQNFELFFYDLRLQLRPPQDVSKDIALIEIDDETLKLLGQWPLPRDFHASLVDVLHELGARAIVFDILFSETTPYDTLFAESISSAGNVYLPQAFDIGSRRNSGEFLRRPTPVLVPIANILQDSIRQKGHINVLIDPDGKIRRTILFIKEPEGTVAQLSLSVACDYLGLNCANAQFGGSKVIIDGQLQIPVSHENELLVNYPGPWGKSFAHFSFLSILKSYQNWKSGQGEADILKHLKNKVCFIGLTATGTVDLRATPLENSYPMLGLQASVFNSLVQGRFIRSVPGAVNALIAVLIFFACLLISVRFPPRASFAGNVLLAALVFAGTTVSLVYFGVWTDLFFPLLIIFITYAVCVSVRWLGEFQQRQLMERELLIAQDIQAKFLIGIDRDIKNLTVLPWFQPAKFVAGDLYDIIRINEHTTGLLIGDVSGKGLPAALLMAQTVSLFRILSKQMTAPDAILGRLNAELCTRSAGRFVTALYCVVDSRAQTVLVSSAGQGPLIMCRGNGQTIEELSLPANVPLGVMQDTVYETLRFDIRPKDTLLLVSDGVTEAWDASGRLFEMDGVKKSILKSGGKSPQTILESLKGSLAEFSGASAQHDDITVILCALNEP